VFQVLRITPAPVFERNAAAAMKVSLSEAMELSNGREVEVLDLDRALYRLAEVDPRKAKLVELRYFGGLTIEEAVAAAGSSPATAERDWPFARAFLRELGYEQVEEFGNSKTSAPLRSRLRSARASASDVRYVKQQVFIRAEDGPLIPLLIAVGPAHTHY
jgi:hypothetical protein